jgi:hypothetical protein
VRGPLVRLPFLASGLRGLVGPAFLACALIGGAATADAQSREFWPEADVWVRFSPAFRISSFVALSKNIDTNYREGNFIAQADYAWGKTRYERRLLDESRAQKMKRFLIRGGYLGGKSLGDDGAEYAERTALTELHVRIPLRGNVLWSHRLRMDVRWLDQDPEPSVRWRYRLMAEKELAAGRTSLVPYVSAEPYYDSRYDTINRVRVIGGATVSWWPRLAIEGNWTYQHDSRSSVTALNAFNLIVHVFFETKGAR